MTGQTSWLSAHLYIDAASSVYGEVADDVITQVVLPLATSLTQTADIANWFFIRYTENGPHVRLRLLPRTSMHVARVRDRVQALLAAAPLVRHEWTTYEPEIWRYGGSQGIAIAEAHFGASSRTTAMLLSNCKAGRDHRLGFGLVLLLILANRLFPSAPAALGFASRLFTGHVRRLRLVDREIASSFATGSDVASSSSLVAAVWDGLDEGGYELPVGFEDFLTNVGGMRAALYETALSGNLILPRDVGGTFHSALSFLAPSYIHMAHNRLGITAYEEAYIAFAAAEGLGRLTTRQREPCPDEC